MNVCGGVLMKKAKIINFSSKKRDFAKASSVFAEGVFLSEKTGMRELAIKKFQEAERLGYKSSRLYCHIAYLCNTDESDVAMKALNKAMSDIENDYYESDVYYLKGWFLWQNNKLDEALEYLFKAEKLGQEHYYIYQAIICSLWKQKNFFKLNAFTSKAIKKFPNEPLFYEYKAFCYDAQEKYEEALKYYLKAEELGETRVYDSISDIYLSMGNNEKALEYLNKALLTEKYFYTYSHKADFYYYTTCNYEKALKYYLKTIECFADKVPEDYAYIYSNISWIYGRTDKDKAIQYAKKGYELAPKNNWCVYRKACTTLYFKEDHKNAKKLLDKAVSLGFPEADTFAEYAYCYLGMKKYKEGLIKFENYLRNNPDDENLLFFQILFFYFSKKYNKVIEILGKKTEEELSIIFTFILTCCHIKQKNYEKALQYFLLFANKTPQNYSIEDETGIIIDVNEISSKLEKKFPFNNSLRIAKINIYKKLNLSSKHKTTMANKTLSYLKEIIGSNSFWIIYASLLLWQIFIKMSA